MRLQATAPAKLNLYLHITGKRDDGYHLLDSLVVFTEFGDAVSVDASDGLSLAMSGPFADGIGDADDNLVMRAAHALQQVTGCVQGAAIALDKHIPIGAGLGGGSSDAAAAARLLNDLWSLNLSDDALVEILAPLGADMSVCVHHKPVIMRGIGDELLVAPTVLNYSVLLVNPMKVLPTADVYRAYTGDYREVMQTPNFAISHNDLTGAAISLCPDIEAVLGFLGEQKGAVLTRMCGSGATCFSLFGDEEACAAAHQAVLQEKPDWWVMPTSLSY